MLVSRLILTKVSERLHEEGLRRYVSLIEATWATKGGFSDPARDPNGTLSCGRAIRKS